MAEPVSLEQIKQHLDVDRDDQDDMLTDMIVAAREWVENYTGLTLTARSLEQGFASFRQCRDLDAWPIRGTAAAVAYADRSGVAQTLGTARVVSSRRPARIMPAFGTYWPDAYEDSITVTIDAGYGTPDEVPFSLKAAIKLLVGNMYANRETTVTGISVADTGTIESLCRPYRMPVIG